MLNSSPEKHVKIPWRPDDSIGIHLDAIIRDFFNNCSADFPDIILYAGDVCSRFIPDIQRSLKSCFSTEFQPHEAFWICPVNQYPAPDISCPSSFKDAAMNADWFEWLWAWSRKIGSRGAFILIETSSSQESQPGGLDAFLLTAAAVGLFPRAEVQKIVTNSESDSVLAMGWFVKKPYRIRPARITDAEDLDHLEQACWQPHLRASTSEIHQRILQFPIGQCVLIQDDRLVGAIYSQRIDSTDLLHSVTSRTAFSLHSPSGQILQLLAVNILPEPLFQGLGDELLSFMLAYSFSMSGVCRVAAVSLCKNYAPDSGSSIQHYITLKNTMGQCLDPILRFHESHGGRIRHVISNYRPDDLDNLGYGVLVDYGNRPKSLQAVLRSPFTVSGQESEVSKLEKVRVGTSAIDATDALTIVEESIFALLPSQKNYRSELALRDLGLDSLKLMELKSLLSHRFGVSIEPGFFFEYVTARDIAAFFRNRFSRHTVESRNRPLMPLRSDADDIAVIGMACRFPAPTDDEDMLGGLSAFRDLLINGQNAVRPLSSKRLHLMGDLDISQLPQGLHYGGQIPCVDAFDASFFGISPREAICMDPQQRVLMETVWEALEHAAIDPGKLAGTRCGVFAGLFGHDYADLQIRRQSPSDIDAYFGTGTSPAVAAGRVSYFLGLSGPSLAIDTACSSSLVAIHLACEGIRSGEVPLAIAGGVNVILDTDIGLSFNRAGMLSSDGRCMAFDAGANGYVRSDGCGVVILKRLSQAIQDGDPIQAIIRASAVNQDGFSNGLTAPNPDAQKTLIQEALSRSRLSSDAVTYVETHGTGTPLGDAVEIQAIAASYGKRRTADHPLILGSVKTNIGHCEAAAGVAGLIKVILSLQNEVIPGHLHFQKPGPHIKLEDIPAIIPRDKLPWPRNTTGPVRRGAVSSYGFSGTNAHIIVEEAPETPQQSHTETDLKPYLLTLSTKTPTAMPLLIRRYAAFLKAEPGTDTASLCHTTHIGRSHFPHRVAFVGKSASDFARQLHASETKNIHMDKQDKRKKRIEGGICELAFLFTGPGSEYSGMGRGLYASEPSFRKNMDACEQILDSIGSPGLIKRLFSNPGQPWRFPAPDAAGLFCIQYALTMLWRTWGISPVVVMGHSLGEYAAACVAGVFSLEDAIQLTATQDRILSKLSPAGVMVSVLAGPDAVLPLLQKENRRVVIAALNSPRNTLIAGPNVSVDRVCATLNRQGIETIQISTACAYHSPLMEPATAEWENAVQSIAYARPQIPLISTLTGQLEKESIAGYPYWSRHISSEVHFSDGVKAISEMGSFVFLEIGPQPTLLSLAKQNLPELKTHWLPSLRHGMDERQQMLTSLGCLYEMGADIHWENVDKGLSCRRISLPAYPFQRQSYWFDAHTKTSTSLLPAKDHFENLLYEMSWEKAGLLDTTILDTTIHPDGSWLILADQIGVGHELSRILMAAGRPCILADVRTFIPNIGIFEEDMAEWQQTLQQGIIDLIGSGKLTHVVYLWALDMPITAQLNPETLRQSQLVTVFAVPQILAALSQIPQTTHARLWLITCGAVPVLTETSAKGRGISKSLPIDSRRSMLLSSVSQAPLWGMGRTAALEFPHLWGGLIDLDPISEGQDAIQIWAQTLLSAIFRSSEEDQIAIRQNRMYMARLKIADSQPTGKPRSQFETLQPLMFCPDASYLITGGLGALGLQTASWMIRQGARHLVLISRREPSKPILDEIHELKLSGANIYVGSADVADMTAMSLILSYIEANMPPLKGVVHAAGILIESLLPEMNTHEAWSVLAPKIQGAWVLHSLTCTYQLDFIIYYSSIAAIWGAKAQGCYAAANQFMDAMAHYNRAIGQPALSVNWGPWQGEGMTGQDSRSWLKRRGLTAIRPEVSFSALSYLLQNDAVQMAVADVNWPLFRRIYQSWGKHSLFDDLPELRRGESCIRPDRMTDDGWRLTIDRSPSTIDGQWSTANSQRATFNGQMRQQLLDAPESDRQTILVAYLQTQTTRIMGISPESGLLNPNQGFFSLGLDSIMAVELRQWIIQDIDIDLPMTALFDFSNMTKLAVYINEMLKVELPLISQHKIVDNLQSTANKSNMQSEIASQLDKELLELETLLRSH